MHEAAVEEKAEAAIETAARLLEDLPSRTYASSALLAEELERVRDGDPSYVLHEYLAGDQRGILAP